MQFELYQEHTSEILFISIVPIHTYAFSAAIFESVAMLLRLHADAFLATHCVCKKS